MAEGIGVKVDIGNGGGGSHYLPERAKVGKDRYAPDRQEYSEMQNSRTSNYEFKQSSEYNFKGSNKSRSSYDFRRAA
jgi:hypothetical protein